jgi:hypothetical protein
LVFPRPGADYVAPGKNNYKKKLIIWGHQICLQKPNFQIFE